MQRIGPDLAQQAGLVTTVFPNVSPNFIRHMVRIWHPRGPEKTEIWSYCVVDKEAPPEIKNAHAPPPHPDLRPQRQPRAGRHEQLGSSAPVPPAASSPAAYPQNLQAHLGHEEKSGAFGGGKRLRRFYARWATMMGAESWGDVDLETKYY